MRHLRQLPGLWIMLPALLGCLLSCGSEHTDAADPSPDRFAGIRKTFEYTDRHGSEYGISYLDTGGSDDVAIVLIHGFGASVYTWKDVIQALAEESRVISVDLKGFGASDKPADGHYSVFDQAEMVDALIGHLGLHRIELGGHSMGGMVAMILVSDPPAERDYWISRLMIFDAPLFRQRLPLFIMAMDIPVLGEACLHLIPPTSVVRLVLTESYYDDGLIEDEEVRAYAAGLASPGGRRALVRSARALADLNESGYTFDFDEVRMPVLIVWGKRDTVLPPGYSFALRDALPGPVSFHVIPKCGHIPTTEKPGTVVPIIKEFLTPR